MRIDMKVELWNLDDFCGIIIPQAIGVVWTNQAGCEYCLHPEIEGIYIPTPIIILEPLHVVESLNLCDINNFLKNNLIEEYFGIPSCEFVEKNKINDAWIPILIKDVDNQFVQLESFKGREAILTYTNCD